jgi:hypothetical protein
LAAIRQEKTVSFDFPTTPAFGTTITMPDGSFRVWDGVKWKAAPSANNLPPGGSGFLPLTGGTVNGDVTITGSVASGHMDTFLTLTGGGSSTFSINAAIGKSVRLTLGGYSAGPPVTTTNFTVNPGPGTTGNPFAIAIGAGPGLHTIDMTQSLAKTRTNWINSSVTGGAFDLTTSPLAIQMSASGALPLNDDNPDVSGASRPYLQWTVLSDTASAGTGGLLSSATFLSIVHNWGGTGMSGGRLALDVSMRQVAPSGSPLDNFFGAARFSTHGAFNQTGGDLTKYMGRNFPLTVATGLQSGATNWYSNIGCEWDNVVNAGASVARNISQQFVLLSGHTNQGVYVDASLLWAAGGGTTGPGWHDLMLIGDQMDFGWPCDEINGSIMRVEVPNNPTAQPPLAKNGIELSAALFSGNAYASRHFAVAGDGTTQHFNARIAKITGGVSLDIPLKIGSFVSIANGGTNNDSSVAHWYRDNAEVPGLWLMSSATGAVNWQQNTAYTVGQTSEANGNVYTVTTAGTSATTGTGPSGTGTGITDGTVVWNFTQVAGVATAVSIMQPPYSTTSPATLTLTNTSAWVGGSFTVNVSWAANNTLSIQPSGGPIKSALLTNAANDAAAASAGVSVGQWYRNGSVMMQRVA